MKESTSKSLLLLPLRASLLSRPCVYAWPVLLVLMARLPTFPPLQGSNRKQTTALAFADNYAMNEHAKNVPTRDFTVSFWAKTPKFNHTDPRERFMTFITYATLGQATQSATLLATACFGLVRLWERHEVLHTARLLLRHLRTFQVDWDFFCLLLI